MPTNGLIELPRWFGIAFAVARMVAAIVGVSFVLPRRGHFGARLAAMLAFATAVIGVAIWYCYYPYPELSTTYQPLSQLVAFVALIVGFVPLITFCFDTNPWAAAACSATGYLVQNLAGKLGSVVEKVAFALEAPFASTAPFFYARNLGCFLLVLAIIVRVLRSRRSTFSQDAASRGSTVIVVVMVTAVCIASDIAIKNTSFAVPAYELTLVGAHILICLTILYLEYEMLCVRTLEIDQALTRTMVEDRARQYEASQESMQRVGRVYHDLRHELARLRVAAGGNQELEGRLAALEEEVATYDAVVHTGNVALDTVLARARMRCEALGIGFSCIANGSALAFMTQADVYVLFGTLADNSIAASQQAPEDERTISVIVRHRGDMVSAHLENPYVADAQLDTTIDVQVVRNLVERYDGTLTMTAAGDVFQTDVMLPVPE